MFPNNYNTLNSQYEDRGNSYRQEEEDLEGTGSPFSGRGFATGT